VSVAGAFGMIDGEGFGGIDARFCEGRGMRDGSGIGARFMRPVACGERCDAGAGVGVGVGVAAGGGIFDGVGFGGGIDGGIEGFGRDEG